MDAQFFLEEPTRVGFPKLGFYFDINPTAFTVFGIEIRWYGVIIAVGMLIAMIYCFKRMREFGINSDRAIDAVVAGVIGAIICARAYYIVFSDTLTFADFFSIRQGGLAIYGGVIGALLFGGVCAKVRKLRILPLFDIASIGFLIGQAAGRWGNFINQEAFGGPTDLPWGMSGYNIQVEFGGLASELVTVHPCFLYESLWCILGIFVLHFLSKKRKFDGEVFLAYSAWYGIGRFFIEGLREDSLYLGRLRVSQVLAGACVIAAVIITLAVFSKIKRSGVPAVLYVDTEESKALIAEEDEAAKKKEKTEEKKDSEEKTENNEEENKDGKDN